MGLRPSGNAVVSMVPVRPWPSRAGSACWTLHCCLPLRARGLAKVRAAAARLAAYQRPDRLAVDHLARLAAGSMAVPVDHRTEDPPSSEHPESPLRIG